MITTSNSSVKEERAAQSITRCSTTHHRLFRAGPRANRTFLTAARCNLRRFHQQCRLSHKVENGRLRRFGAHSTSACVAAADWSSRKTGLDKVNVLRLRHQCPCNVVCYPFLRLVIRCVRRIITPLADTRKKNRQSIGAQVHRDGRRPSAFLIDDRISP
jgi:hypothetical protein